MNNYGEFWFIEGYAQLADSKVGRGHDSYVEEYLTNSYHLPFNPTYVDSDQLIEWACKNYKNLINDLKNRVAWDNVLTKLENQRKCQPLMQYLYSDGILNENVFFDFYKVPSAEQELLKGQGISTEEGLKFYGMKNLGWQRVENNNVEIWQFNSSTLNSIITAFNSILPNKNKKKILINLFIFSNNSWYENIPLSVLENIKSPNDLEEYIKVKNGKIIAKNMNWYKVIKIAFDEDDEAFQKAEEYFSIGQGENIDQSYCWLWLNGKLLTKLGGTHNINFRHLIPNANNVWHDNYFRGWYDPDLDVVSVVLRNKATSVPYALNNALRTKFGPNFQYKIF